MLIKTFGENVKYLQLFVFKLHIIGYDQKQVFFFLIILRITGSI